MTKLLQGSWTLIDDHSLLHGDTFLNGVYSPNPVADLKGGESVLALGPTCNAKRFQSSGYYAGKPTVLWTREAFLLGNSTDI